jgi:tRNA-Thr(GGU) m(6)t(6)A37 methyltransferase TsaA
MKLLKTSVILLAIVATASSEKPPNAKTGPSSQGKGMSQSEIWTDSSQIHFKPIGVVKSPFKDQAGTPIQPVYAQGTKGKVVVFDAYKKALKDLDGFSRIWLIYYFDRAKPWTPLTLPFRDNQERGLFATRAPARPNAIGISAVKVISVKENEIEVEELDILDNTPILDIKPYVSGFDSYPNEKAGWYDTKKVDRKTADDRFNIN